METPTVDQKTNLPKFKISLLVSSIFIRENNIRILREYGKTDLLKYWSTVSSKMFMTAFNIFKFS